IGARLDRASCLEEQQLRPCRECSVSQTRLRPKPYRRTNMLKGIDRENGTQQAGLEMISAHKMSDHSMKRTYFPGITDIAVVTDPAEIRTISNDSRFDRDFIGRGPVRNVQLLRKILS